jgi:hypothetical protein
MGSAGVSPAEPRRGIAILLATLSRADGSDKRIGRKSGQTKGQGAGRSWGEPRETAAPGRDIHCNNLTHKNKHH